MADSIKWQVGNTEIRVGEDGKFYAEIDGKAVRRASLSALKRLIEQDMSALPVLVPDRGYSRWHIKQDEIVRVIGHGRLKGRHATDSYRTFEDVYLYDEEALKKLEAILEEYEELERKWNAVLKTMTRVTAKNLNELREQYQQMRKEAKSCQSG